MVLVVEDEADVRALTAAGLRQLGFVTMEAGDATQALDLLRRMPDISLLLTDVIMPGGTNGNDLAKEAKRLRPDLAVVFMSGYAELPLSVEEATALNEHLLHKPFGKSHLAETLRRALDERKRRAADQNRLAPSRAD
jgi:hypothetical protein